MKNVKSLKTSTSQKQKEYIKRYLSNELQKTDLTKLFHNLDNELVPEIFKNKEKYEEIIKKYKSKTIKRCL